jgi:hypothetical protein
VLSGESHDFFERKPQDHVCLYPLRQTVRADALPGVCEVTIIMIPPGYIVGMDRNNQDKVVSHLYRGTHQDPGLPMCARGWNRSDGESYSIFRGQISEKGICQICYRRAVLGLAGVESRKRKTRWI